MEKEIAVLIPIVFILVTGIVIVTIVFFKSREKQILIEKGLSPQDIKMFFEEKKDPFRMLKTGIVILFFGLGLGFGLILNQEYERDYWVPLLMFTLTGLGFIIANLAARSLEKSAREKLS